MFTIICAYYTPISHASKDLLEPYDGSKLLPRYYPVKCYVFMLEAFDKKGVDNTFSAVLTKNAVSGHVFLVGHMHQNYTRV